jgi:hypothetical protein
LCSGWALIAPIRDLRNKSVLRSLSSFGDVKRCRDLLFASNLSSPVYSSHHDLVESGLRKFAAMSLHNAIS